jgi:hypothetical protein
METIVFQQKNNSIPSDVENQPQMERLKKNNTTPLFWGYLTYPLFSGERI